MQLNYLAKIASCFRKVCLLAEI